MSVLPTFFFCESLIETLTFSPVICLQAFPPAQNSSFLPLFFIGLGGSLPRWGGWTWGRSYIPVALPLRDGNLMCYSIKLK